jgi:O-antigen/teichoic acid export membrane protein
MADVSAKYAAAFLVVIGSPVLAISVVGGGVFGFVFGPEWTGAASYAVPLGLTAALNAASMPLVGSIPIIGIQREYLMFEIFGLMARALVLFLPHWKSPLEGVIWTSSVYGLLQIAFFLSVFVRLKRVDLKERSPACV